MPNKIAVNPGPWPSQMWKSVVSDGGVKFGIWVDFRCFETLEGIILTLYALQAKFLDILYWRGSILLNFACFEWGFTDFRILGNGGAGPTPPWICTHEHCNYKYNSQSRCKWTPSGKTPIRHFSIVPKETAIKHRLMWVLQRSLQWKSG